jgi:hypothetical protein
MEMLYRLIDVVEWIALPIIFIVIVIKVIIRNRKGE